MRMWRQGSAWLATGLLLLAGCQAPPSATYNRLMYGDPAKDWLGMSKQQILACAGSPASSFAEGGTETLVYHYSGAGPVPGQPQTKGGTGADADAKGGDVKSGGGGILGKKKDKNWDCEATMTFDGGRLIRVNYAHRLVRSPYQWQSVSDPKKQQEMKDAPLPTCTFSLPNCNPAQH